MKPEHILTYLSSKLDQALVSCCLNSDALGSAMGAPAADRRSQIPSSVGSSRMDREYSTRELGIRNERCRRSPATYYVLALAERIGPSAVCQVCQV